MGQPCMLIFLLSLSLCHGTVSAQAEACRTVDQADIVFLVDESWSVGQVSFSKIKEFVSAIMSSFQNKVIGERGIRFGVTVFGDIPRMRIALTDYSTLDEILAALKNLPFEGGASRTGDALQFLSEYAFSPVITRDNTPKIAVLITNGRSDDQVDGPAKTVDHNGITLYAVGVRGADEAELRRIVTEPYEEHLLLSADFSLLAALLPKLSRRLCFTAAEPPRPLKNTQPVEENVVGPRDLQVSDVSYSSLRLTWSHATGDVTGYRLLVDPHSPKGHLIPSLQRQIDLKGDVRTVVVTELTPVTEYLLTVYAIYPDLVGDSVSIHTQTTPLSQVTNFRVMEEGLFSLRLSWTPPLGKLHGYKIVVPRSNRPGLTYEQTLPGDAFTHVIDNLEEDMQYTISISAIYPQGPSEPVSVQGHTLKLVPVHRFLVQNATTDTVQARWPAVKGATGYRLTWSNLDGHIENVNLGETYNFYMIQGLAQGSEYTITINPIFVDIEGPVTSTKAKTLESSAVQTLKASAVSTNSASVSWNSVPGATGYRLAWSPTPEFMGRDRPRQLALNSSTTEYLLKNVVHDTEYVLSLYVLFGSLVGPGITSTFRTSPLGYVSNFEVTSYSSSSIDVEWSPIVGASEYKLTWSTGGGSPQTRYLERSNLFHRLEGLRPDTTYTVSISAVYANSEGPQITLSQLTAGAVGKSERIHGVKEVKVVDVGVNSLTVSWRKAPGVSGYRISWSPFLGGEDKSQFVSAATTMFTIPHLQASEAYTIQVASALGSRAGSPALVTARTLDLPKVNGFAALDTSDSSVVLNWTSVAGVSGYLLSWKHISELDTKTDTLGPGFTTYKINDLLYGRTYKFTIKPLYGEVEGPISTLYHQILTTEPPLGPAQSASATVTPKLTHITTMSKDTPDTNADYARNTLTTAAKPPSKSTFAKGLFDKSSVTRAKISAATFGHLTTMSKVTSASETEAIARTGPVCGSAKADIVFLVDESSSIGSNNFVKLKDFLFRVATYFPVIGPSGTQIAVVHYSDEPRIEFSLSDYKDRNSVLRALRGLRYGGGNTRTGKGISFVLKKLFQESLGMRQDVAHIMVLITDGRAQDDVVPPSRIAHALGVSVLAIGVANADMDELRRITPPASYNNIFYSPNFDDFASIERDFISNICSEELISEFKGHDESAQLDTPTEDPDELTKPQGPCPSQCMKGQKGAKGDGFGLGGLMFQNRPGDNDPFSLNSKGEKGERGPPGTDGVPGLPGRPGRTGPPGSAGQRGPSGVPGDIGPSGATGPKGQRGERGEPGYILGGMEAGFTPGRKGEPGSSGPQGPPGVPGATGSSGLPGQPGPTGSPGISVKGERGEEGAKGLRGKAGLKGEKGDHGKDGVLGLPGSIGIDGIQGSPGQKGEKGAEGIGIPGVQGPRGVPGQKGNTGLSGPMGPKGDSGIQGIQGVMGLRGKKGTKGDQGEKGEKGNFGPVGPQGPTGLPGINGPKGDLGQRGAPGEPAKGILGPTGKKGARGDTGPVGPAGPQGIKGFQGGKGEKGSPGFGIPGQPGPKGENGERGNVGLSGKPGPKGFDGSKGDKGSVGFPGNPGVPGLRGKDGQPGDHVANGPFGLPGPQGDKGDIGLPGAGGKKGERGVPGNPGLPGIVPFTSDNNVLTRGMKGEIGAPGQKGEPGLSGPRGVDGKPGPPGISLGESSQKGEPRLQGDKGDRGDRGRVGVAGMPGLPGTPGKPGIDGKRGLSGKDGEQGLRGEDGKKGHKGDRCTHGKDGSKGEPGVPGVPGSPSTFTNQDKITDDLRKAFPVPMGPPGATGPPGIKGEKGDRGSKGERGEAAPAGKVTGIKDIEVMFESYGIRLPLLKALIDRLLLDGMENVLHGLSTTSKKSQKSNIITDYTSSANYETLNRPVPETKTEEELRFQVDGPLPEPASSEKEYYNSDRHSYENYEFFFPQNPLLPEIGNEKIEVQLEVVPRHTSKEEELPTLAPTTTKEAQKVYSSQIRLKRSAPWPDYTNESQENPVLTYTNREEENPVLTYTNTEEENPVLTYTHMEEESSVLSYTNTEEENPVLTYTNTEEENPVLTYTHMEEENPVLTYTNTEEENPVLTYKNTEEENPVLTYTKTKEQEKRGIDQYSERSREKQMHTNVSDGNQPEPLRWIEGQREEEEKWATVEHTRRVKRKRETDAEKDHYLEYDEEEMSGDYERETEEDVDSEREDYEMDRDRERMEMERKRIELDKERKAELEPHRENMKRIDLERDEMDRKMIEKDGSVLESEEWEPESSEGEEGRDRNGEYEGETDGRLHSCPEYLYLKGSPGENGPPGPKGEIGEQGQKGEPGIGHRGPVGQAGPPGHKGEPGEPGPSGAQGTQGIHGNPGTAGAQGLRGQLGDPGEPGREGERGRRGKNGSPGPPGAPGPLGEQGPPGVPGRKGEKGNRSPGEPGSRGVVGLQGRKGEKGTAGAKGTPGPLGLKGLQGFKGVKGDRGFAGFQGERGSILQIQGPRGYKGTKGERGVQGPPGFDGDKGEKGEDGPPGVKGFKGDTGTKGAFGPFGARGPVGQKGDPGETGANGVVGHHGDRGLDGATGAKGDMGLQGQKGDQGDPGQQGLPGDYGVKGDKGLRGIPGHAGSQGLDGEKGDMGFSGSTGIPGLNGLTGRKGDKGDGGINGKHGVPGQKGEKGPIGFAGFPGFKGSEGKQGSDGETGRQGSLGPKGDMGSKGERGRKSRGKPCQRGPSGMTGERGGNGKPGNTGPKGDKGEPGLSVQEVKEFITQEVVVKCGLNSELVLSIDQDSSIQQQASISSSSSEDEKGDDLTLGNGKKVSTNTAHIVRREERTLSYDYSPDEILDLCQEPMAEGTCSEHVMLWYYHRRSGECRPFVYGGCEGNRNRFPTRQECQTICDIKNTGS